MGYGVGRFSLLLAFFLLSGDAAAGDFESISREAEAARTEGRLLAAESAYQQALELRPDWAEGWWYLSNLRYERGRFGDAGEAFEKLSALTPGRPAVTAMLGLCRFQVGDYQAALVHLEEVFDRNLEGGGNLGSVARYHAAILFNLFSRFEEARQALTPYAVGGVQNAEILEAYGNAVLRKARLPGEGDSEELELTRQVGRAAFFADSGEPDRAEALFAHLTERFPAEPNLYFAYATFMRHRSGSGGPLRFVSLMLRELEISPEHLPARLALGAAYLELGRVDEARSMAEKAVELDPDSAAAGRLLGKVLIEEEAYAEAAEVLSKAVELDPEDLESRLDLSHCFIKQGASEEAAMAIADFSYLKEGGFPLKQATSVPGVAVNLEADEVVLGVVIAGEARAYPVNFMNGPINEAVNDRLGGEEIVASWCPINQSGVVFRRELDGRTYDFGVAGLEQGTLTLYDAQTRSLWSQLGGQARFGPLLNRTLEKVPSVITTWGLWRRLYPQTSVFRGTGEVHEPTFTGETFRESLAGVSPDRDVEIQDLVIGIELPEGRPAYLVRQLAAVRLVNSTFADTGIVLYLDSDGITFRAFSRLLDGRELTFRLEGEKLRDLQTASTWDPLSGRAVSGQLVGQTLRPLPAFYALWFSWRNVHPEADLVEIDVR